MAGKAAFLAVLALLRCEAKHLRAMSGDEETCAPLKNYGTFSTVEVKVGTPAQHFDLVADTGSNAVIVQSCVCQDKGSCPEEFGKCFRGTNKSSSFLMRDIEVKGGLAAILITFGSGEVEAIVASDKVQVGLETAIMGDSLLLMVNQRLTIRGQFEGILGLGRPNVPKKANIKEDEMELDTPGFLEKAGIDRFSMCFNYKGEGVLGLNTLQQAEPMGSVGSLHWGLEFQGISVGDEVAQKVLFCDPSTKKVGMETACALIPDSGTTLMMGPEKHIVKLYTDLCQNWERCRKTHEGLKKELERLNADENTNLEKLSLAQSKGEPLSKEYEDILKKLQEVLGGAVGGGGGGGAQDDPWGAITDGTGGAYGGLEGAPGAQQPLQMHETFQLLLENCESWLNETSLDKEMPSMTFHVAAADGVTQQLKMRPESYILETTQLVAHREIKKLMGIFPIEVLSKQKEKVCMPAFGPMQYLTELNGDVWIMGTPLFYEYNVHYDRAPAKPTMAFVAAAEEACGNCVGGQIKRSTALLDKSSSGVSHLRKLDSEPVVRQVDPELPF